MDLLSYNDAPFAVRDDLVDAHRRAWRRLAGPGTWLDGPRRVAIAAETRQARDCRLCRERKMALSPNAVAGDHDDLGALPEPWVDAVHRIVSDPARLSKSWLEGVLGAGIEVTEFVEMVGVACTTLAIDGFARILGIDLLPLPEPVGGAPSRRIPAGARQGPAWVPWVMPEDVTEAEAGLYDHGASNVCKALSLVPDAALGFFDVVLAQYLPGMTAMRDFSRNYRAIDRSQIELLAARVSAINQCAYWTTSHAALLRASGEHAGKPIDLNAVLGNGHGGVAHGGLLVRFAEAALGRDEGALAQMRAELSDAMGEAALVDAAAVVAAYEGLDRVADATGIPIDEERLEPTADLREQLGVSDFQSGRDV